MGEQLELQIGLAQWEGRWGGRGFSGGGSGEGWRDILLECSNVHIIRFLREQSKLCPISVNVDKSE